MAVHTCFVLNFSKKCATMSAGKKTQYNNATQGKCMIRFIEKWYITSTLVVFVGVAPAMGAAQTVSDSSLSGVAAKAGVVTSNAATTTAPATSASRFPVVKTNTVANANIYPTLVGSSNADAISVGAGSDAVGDRPGRPKPKLKGLAARIAWCKAREWFDCHITFKHRVNGKVVRQYTRVY